MCMNFKTLFWRMGVPETQSSEEKKNMYFEKLLQFKNMWYVVISNSENTWQYGPIFGLIN